MPGPHKTIVTTYKSYGAQQEAVSSPPKHGKDSFPKATSDPFHSYHPHPRCLISTWCSKGFPWWSSSKQRCNAMVQSPEKGAKKKGLIANHIWSSNCPSGVQSVWAILNHNHFFFNCILCIHHVYWSFSKFQPYFILIVAPTQHQHHQHHQPGKKSLQPMDLPMDVVCLTHAVHLCRHGLFGQCWWIS